jgi:iron complex outermembrane receptor protein
MRKAVASPFEGSHALCVRKTDYRRALMLSPHSVNVITEDMLLNQEVKTVNEALSYLPSVIIRDQQGQEVARPQPRGFQGSVVLNTRIDGMNIIGPTAYAAEGFSAIQVLNGPGGAFYGPETPAGVFNYITKKPTDEQLVRWPSIFSLTRAVFASGTSSCRRSAWSNAAR